MDKNSLSVALGDPCAQPTQLNASMLHPCTNATKLNYFDGSKAGFGIFIIVLFLFPVGQYHSHKSISFCTAVILITHLQFCCENDKHQVSLFYFHSQSFSGLYGGISPQAQVQEVSEKRKSWWQNRRTSCGSHWYEICKINALFLVSKCQ